MDPLHSGTNVVWTFFFSDTFIRYRTGWTKKGVRRTNEVFPRSNDSRVTGVEGYPSWKEILFLHRKTPFPRYTIYLFGVPFPCWFSTNNVLHGFVIRRLPPLTETVRRVVVRWSIRKRRILPVQVTLPTRRVSTFSSRETLQFLYLAVMHSPFRPCLHRKVFH